MFFIIITITSGLMQTSTKSRAEEDFNYICLHFKKHLGLEYFNM